MNSRIAYTLRDSYSKATAHTAALDSRAASHKKLTTFDRTQTFGIISCEKGGSNPTMSTKINTIIVCLV